MSQLLERILMENKESIRSFGSKLFFIYLCSIWVRSRKRDIFEKRSSLFLPICNLTFSDTDLYWYFNTIFSIQNKVKSFIGGWERNKKEAEQAAALQAVLELCLMSYSECNIKNMTDKTVDETAWRDEIKTWSEKTDWFLLK